MSAESTEQRPLLCEDLSEEEHFPDFPRRYRPIYRGRAKTSAKGATAIITRWPEHWSSSLTYWWIGLSIMALTFFLIYNSVIAFVLLPMANTKPAKLRASNKIDSYTSSSLPEIFMHFFVNTDEEENLDKYLPYIEAISEKNLDYTFNLILLFNDTVHEPFTHSAEENNEIALNSLWSKEHFYKQKQNPHKNIKIRQVALSQFMDESPMRTNWRHVPAHFIRFLVKALSLWDKGGVAINPEILTPRTPNALYMEKLQHILKKNRKQRENVPNEPKLRKVTSKHKDKFKKKVNNIRDIINILEHEDEVKTNMGNHDSQENLTEAESVNIPVVSNNERKLFSSELEASQNKSKLSLPTIIELPKIPLVSTFNDTDSLDHKQFTLTNIKSRDDADVLEVVNEGFDILDDNSETRLSLLPLFLEFLFHDKQKVSVPKKKQGETDNLARHRKSAMIKEKNKTIASVLPNSNDTKPVEKYKPMIIPAKGIVPERFLKTKNSAFDSSREIIPEELTIDLKGNILATKTSCHAFIGTVFSNVIHHSPGEPLQELIISELSLFCKGLLSSCRGIDVILL